MKKFSNIKFVESSANKIGLAFKKSPLDEIVIVGRSNVGKSSLLNHLFNHKNLAKVSSKPGKTQTINFFKIDDLAYLVDLPGYGFAKRSHTIKEAWAKDIDTYLNSRENIKLILLLLDMRRELTDNDINFYKWAAFKKIPVFIIFTKCDKVKSNLQNSTAKNVINTLNKIDSDAISFFIHFSIKEDMCKKILQDKIYHFLENYGTDI